jgi:hypothetical protein
VLIAGRVRAAPVCKGAGPELYLKVSLVDKGSSLRGTGENVKLPGPPFSSLLDNPNIVLNIPESFLQTQDETAHSPSVITKAASGPRS